MSGIVTALSSVVNSAEIYNIFINISVVITLSVTVSLSIYLIYKVIKGTSKGKAEV